MIAAGFHIESRGVTTVRVYGVTFKRHAGTATVTIADLSRPRVGVAIEVPGQSIGARWADMPLNDGSFASGTAGRGWLAGNFHGPGHEEAWGVFDTADHLGAFGAKREHAAETERVRGLNTVRFGPPGIRASRPVGHDALVRPAWAPPSRAPSGWKRGV